jgi:hypothetical protein
MGGGRVNIRLDAPHTRPDESLTLGITRRIGAIVIADMRIRFRRMSTLVVFLFMTACAYLWVPAPSTGRALLQIAGQRCLYNSAAIGMATASISALMIGLFGYYVISNAIARDTRSRCGFVIASTTMRSSEYLAGKFAGNVIFLVTFMTGFMLCAMAMLLVRGEAPLNPFIFAKQYVLLVPTTIVLVSAIAIVFESIPFLSGRFGDVAFFFFWAFAIGFAVNAIEHGASVKVAGIFDMSGLGYLLDQTRKVLHTNSMSIGSSNFDPKKGVFIYNGLSWDPAWLVPRTLSMLLPVPMLVIARLAFHRFDPVRVKQGSTKHGSSWWSRINLLFKPFTRAAMTLVTRGSRPSLIRSSFADALLTISATPVFLIAVIGTSIAALASPSINAVMVVVFPAIAISIADIATRESRAGTSALVWSTPLIKPRLVAWKMLVSFSVASLFLVVPLLRGANIGAALAGALFVCAAATFLGIVSGNPKTFIVLFLSFWYLVVSDKGATPSLDFGGFNGAATKSTAVGYLGAAIACVLVAQAVHAWRTHRA